MRPFLDPKRWAWDLERVENMKTQPLYISTDKQSNTQLAAQLAGVRGGMVAAAEAAPMPVRFDAVPHPDQRAMIITDIETGRSSTVALCHYRGVRETLSALFG